VTPYVRRAWEPRRRCVVAAAAWRHGGVVLRLRPQRRSTTAMVRAAARRPRLTCVVAQRLRWRGVARRRGGEAVRAAGEAARAAMLLASGRGMCVDCVAEGYKAGM
jgi:hypothetical protein